jgi:large subunit ribosomal protein L3
MIGLIGTKIGMTQVFDEQGVLTPVTVIEIKDNTVVGERTEEKNGYKAVVLGAFEMKEKHATKPYAGQFTDGVTPQKYIAEFRNFDKECKVGDSLTIEELQDLEFVDVQGISKGKGYQGVMKRHGFGGGRKTHGSKFHRGLGSTGMAAWPSKVLKGTKMPGRMGTEKTQILNLEVVRVDTERKALIVKGAVPGKKKGIVIVRNAAKKY